MSVQQEEHYDPSPRWFLLYTKPRQEFIAERQLKNQKFDAYLPLAKGDKRLKQRDAEPLYQSYMFCRLTPGVSDFAKVAYTIGVRWLVKSGQHYHIATDALIEKLKARHNQDNLIEVGQSEYEIGNHVRISSGFYKDYKGIIENIHKGLADVWFYTSDKTVEDFPLE